MNKKICDVCGKEVNYLITDGKIVLDCFSSWLVKPLKLKEICEECRKNLGKAIDNSYEQILRDNFGKYIK